MPKCKEFATIILRVDEGFEEKPYHCSEGYPTIGYGFRIPNTNKGDPLPDMEMTREEADSKLAVCIESAYKTLAGHINTVRAFGKLSDIRQAVLISMCHQVGFVGLVKFTNMWKAIAENDFDRASAEVLDSVAAKQAPNRFERNAEMMRTGQLVGYYL